MKDFLKQHHIWFPIYSAISLYGIFYVGEIVNDEPTFNDNLFVAGVYFTIAQMFNEWLYAPVVLETEELFSLPTEQFNQRIREINEYTNNNNNLINENSSITR